jgi:2-hydroxychromene-2-carboxylate isomerase
MSTLRFHFDVISPYAWLAWTQIHTLADRYGATVEPVPVLFAGLLNHHGQLGPAEIPAKRRYVYEDCFRHADALGLPIQAPPHHPFNPLLALRVAGLDAPANVRRRLIDALFSAVWCDGTGVEDRAHIEALAEAAGLPDAVARATEPQAKLALRDATTRAIEEGVFGVPTILVDTSLFWGLDSLPHLERYLQGHDPVGDSPGLIEAFETMTPSVVRPR